MGAADLIKKVKNAFGDEPHYLPHNIKDTILLYGVPPAPITGLEYLLAYHNNPQNKLVMGLTGTGVFVTNNNKSGVIEFGILDGSVSCGAIQVLQLTGIPFPLFATDKATGGTSTILGSACQEIATPEWRRGAAPGIAIYTFATPKLVISKGIRLVE